MFGNFFLLTALTAAVASAQDIPGMAAGILEQSKLAEQAVIQHNQAAALDHIGQGSTLASEILQAMPSSASRPVMVQVYKNTETTTTYVPAKRSRNGEFNMDRLKKNSAATGVEAEITTGRLDINSAASRLQDAQAAVEREDWTTASSDLNVIPESVLQTTVEGNMPLLEARQNLRLAKFRVEEGRYKDARAPLRAAAGDLADYERLGLGPLSQNAEYFRDEIANYADRVAKHHDEAATQIDYWLGFLDKWYDQATS